MPPTPNGLGSIVSLIYLRRAGIIFRAKLGQELYTLTQEGNGIYDFYADKCQ